jgi:hypothetical protein
MPSNEFNKEPDGFPQGVKLPPFAKGISKVYVPGEPESEMKEKKATEVG